MSVSADRNLLFGILALQLDFVSRDALIAAMNAWVLDKSQPLGQILHDRHKLPAARLRLLDDLVAEHLIAHDGDARQCLSSVHITADTVSELREVQDADVQASLAYGGLTIADSGPSARVDRPAEIEARLPAGRYRVLRAHARGGLGEVFVAEDTELHREVALKEIQTRHADKSTARNRFLLEAEITGRLEHPGIVPVYGLGAYPDGRPFYAMRFIKGDSLKDAIDRFHSADSRSSAAARQRLSIHNLVFRDLLKRFIDVCNAVGYAHSRGVIHRDLKPANVMLGKFGETLVVDWGLAKLVGRGDTVREPADSEATLRPAAASDYVETQAGLAVGTPAFMSPEQAAGRLDEVGPASDVYSLGATLYSMLAGKLPFQGSAVQVLRQVQCGEYRAPREVAPGVPRALDAICRKAMALRPANRYVSAQALAIDIEHWLADDPVTAYDEPLLTRAARSARRHKALVVGLAMLVIVGMTAAAVDVIRVRRQRAQTEVQRDQAEIARRHTREALNTSTDIVQELLPRRQEIRGFERATLRKLLERYEAFAQAQGDTEAARESRADGLKRVASIHEQLGDLKAADAAYRGAIEEYGNLAAAGPDAFDYLRKLGECTGDLGRVLHDLDKVAEAESTFRRAIELETRLVRDHPADRELRLQLSSTYQNSYGVLNETGRLTEAEQVLSEALRIQTELDAEQPDDERILQAQAKTQQNLAIVFAATRRQKEAEDLMRDGLKTLERLRVRSPMDRETRFAISVALNNLALILQQFDQFNKSEAAFRESIKQIEQLVSEYPSIPHFRRQMAMNFGNFSNLYKSKLKFKDDLEYIQKAHAILEKLVADFPDIPDYRDGLCDAHVALSASLQIRDPKQADALLVTAVEMSKQLAAEHPEVATYQNTCGIIHFVICLNKYPQPAATKIPWANAALDYARRAHAAKPYFPTYQNQLELACRLRSELALDVKDHVLAASLADEWSRISKKQDTSPFDAARFLCRCIPFAEKDEKLAAADRASSANSYAERAMKLLRQAVDHGFNDSKRLSEHKDLDPLRSRADFRALLAELPPAAAKAP